MSNNVSSVNNTAPVSTATTQASNSVMQQVSAQLSNQTAVTVNSQSAGSTTLNSATASRILNDAIDPKKSYYTKDTDLDTNALSGLTI
jgi:hypothetical protein